MINARPHGAQEHQAPNQPSREYHDLPLSSVVPCGVRHESARQGAFANLDHTAPIRALLIRTVSLMGTTVVNVADLAVVDAECLVADDAALVGELDDIPEVYSRLAPERNRLRLDENALNDVARGGCAFNLRAALHHDQSPCFVEANIGPMVLLRQEVFAA
jgi:hypothetical protein